MRIICAADTHNGHRGLVVPDGDVFIHAGDATDKGTKAELIDFFLWMADLPHPQKIFVPGNHDELFFWNRERAMELVPDGVDVLLGSGVRIDGYLECWGAPWTAGLPSGAPGEAGAFVVPDRTRTELWDKAPAALDVLVCHAPPLVAAKAMGDDLVDLTIWRACPRLVVCGHVHWARGVYETENSLGETTLVVNAACREDGFKLLQPILVEI